MIDHLATALKQAMPGKVVDLAHAVFGVRIEVDGMDEKEAWLDLVRYARDCQKMVPFIATASEMTTGNREPLNVFINKYVPQCWSPYRLNELATAIANATDRETTKAILADASFPVDSISPATRIDRDSMGNVWKVVVQIAKEKNLLWQVIRAVRDRYPAVLVKAGF